MLLTKMFTAVLLTGALWVAGDAAYQNVGCCFPGADCCPFGECCFTSSQSQSQSSGSSCCDSLTRANALKAKSSCCSEKSACCTEAANNACCDAEIVFCTRTGELYYGCCCEIVNGRHRCLVTGDISDECCCVPIE